MLQPPHTYTPIESLIDKSVILLTKQTQMGSLLNKRIIQLNYTSCKNHARSYQYTSVLKFKNFFNNSARYTQTQTKLLLQILTLQQPD